jgi:group I intron endonuclease
MDHIKGRDSNIRLQRAINKIGLSKFNILIYYFHTDSAVLLTDIETSIIASFPFDSLYNFKKEANSMLGYKHTKEAIEKIKLRYLNKNNHPMFGKKHTDLSLSLITKPGKLNPMFGKKHRLSTIKLMSLKKSIRPIGLYDFNHNLIEKFINQVELANKFNICKSTVSRYIKSGKIFKEKYFIKEINNK